MHNCKWFHPNITEMCMVECHHSRLVKYIIFTNAKFAIFAVAADFLILFFRLLYLHRSSLVPSSYISGFQYLHFFFIFFSAHLRQHIDTVFCTQPFFAVLFTFIWNFLFAIRNKTHNFSKRITFWVNTNSTVYSYSHSYIHSNLIRICKAIQYWHIESYTRL